MAAVQAKPPTMPQAPSPGISAAYEYRVLTKFTGLQTGIGFQKGLALQKGPCGVWSLDLESFRASDIRAPETLNI